MEYINIPKLNTENTMSLWALFSGCKKLNSLDVSNFVTSTVKDFNDIFANCSSLTEINFGEKSWDTAEGQYMRSMFEGCSSMKSLSLSKFDTKNVEVMSNMFKDCSNLVSLDIKDFNTKKVSIIDNMFSGVTSLRELDLTGFDTSNVASYEGIWDGITDLNLKIDESKNTKILENKPEGVHVNPKN